MPTDDGEAGTHADGPVRCTACGRTFESDAALAEHVKRVGLVE